MITRFRDFVLESKLYANDHVYIHYWVTGDVCEVKIVEVQHGKVLVSYDIEESPYAGAPEQWIKKTEIISAVA